MHFSILKCYVLQKNNIVDFFSSDYVVVNVICLKAALLYNNNIYNNNNDLKPYLCLHVKYNSSFHVLYC